MDGKLWVRCVWKLRSEQNLSARFLIHLRNSGHIYSASHSSRERFCDSYSDVDQRSGKIGERNHPDWRVEYVATYFCVDHASSTQCRNFKQQDSPTDCDRDERFDGPGREMVTAMRKHKLRRVATGAICQRRDTDVPGTDHSAGRRQRDHYRNITGRSHKVRVCNGKCINQYADSGDDDFCAASDDSSAGNGYLSRYGIERSR